MKKWMLRVLICAALVGVFCLPSLAVGDSEERAVINSGTCGTNLAYTLYSDGELVISGTGAMEYWGAYIENPWYKNRAAITTVTIEDGVTNIGKFAFCHCVALLNITIPDSVTSIGESAFYGCDALTTVTIPDSVTSIGNYAFDNCKSLTTVTIPDSVTSIGSYAFRDCSALTMVTMGDSVTSIGTYAFYKCFALADVYYTGDIAGWCGISFGELFADDILTFDGILYANPKCYGDNLYIGGELLAGELVIPDSVESIKFAAFSSCTSLTTVTIPDSVTSIGSYAFRDCSALTMVTMGDSVTSIGSEAFYNCTSLTTVTMGDGVTDIGNAAFEYCSALTTITIPDSVTSIGYSAFYECDALTSVIIPDRVTSIGYSAFGNCDALTSVVIGSGVTEIRDYAFGSCAKLSKVYYIGSEQLWYKLVIGIGDGNSYLTNAARKYVSWSDLETVTVGKMENGTLSVVGVAAKGEQVTVTAIPAVGYRFSTLYVNGVAQEGYTFAVPSDTKNVTLTAEFVLLRPDDTLVTGGSCGDNVIWVLYESGELVIYGEGAMKNYRGTGSSSVPWYNNRDGVKTVTIEDSVTSIGAYAFSSCDALTSVVIGSGVTSIGAYAFSSCDALTSVVIGSGVTGIAYSAFEKCSALTTVTIPDSVTSIGEDAFSNCTSLTTVTIGNGVTSIWSYAFRYCSALTTVTIPDSVTSIGDSAFEYCSALTSVTIGDSVTSIGDSAFEYCSALTTVTMGDSVTSIGNGAFECCYNLTHVYYVGDENAWNAITIGYYNGFLTVATRHYITDLGDMTITVEQSEGGTIFAPGVSAKGAQVTVIVTPAVGYKLGTLYVNGVAQEGYTFTVPSDAQTVTLTAEFAAVRPGETAVTGGACGNNVSWALYESGELVIYGEGAMENWEYSSDVSWYAYCSDIKTATIEDSVTSIGSQAFYNCKSLTTVTIPDSVTSIGGSAFAYCDALTSVTIPDSVTSIGNSAFGNCSKIAHVYYVGDEVAWNAITIGSSNSYLTNATRHYITDLSDIVTVTVGQCENGTIAAPGMTAKSEQVTITVTPAAGYRLSKLYVNGVEQERGLTFTVPNNVQTVTLTAEFVAVRPGETAVTGGACGDNVRWALYRSGELAIYGNGAMWNYWNYDYFPWYSDRYNIKTVVVLSGVTSIVEEAFYDCDALTSVTIPDSVTSIGDYAFRSCNALTSVAIGSGVTSIGYSAFGYCDALTSVAIGSGVTSIGGDAFYGCDALTSVIIPDSVTSIGYSAFCNCDALTTVTIPDSVTSIGEYAFSSCDALTSVVIGSGVTSIGSSAFDNCSSLTGVHVAGDNLSYSSQDGVLFNKDKTKLIRYPDGKQGAYEIPDSVTSIGGSAFRECSALTSVTIGNGVTSIGEYAFSSCDALTSVVIGSGVTSIGGDAFYDCDALKFSIYCGTQEQWEQVSVGWGNEELTETLHCGTPVSLTAQDVEAAYPVGTMSVKPTAVTLTLDTGEEIDVTEIAGVTCDLATVGQGKVTVSWGTTSTDIPVYVYSGAHAILEVADAHNAQLKLYAQKAGCAIAAFYDRTSGQMLAVQRFDMPVGNSQTTLTEQNIDLTTVDCKIILLDGDSKPLCGVIEP